MKATNRKQRRAQAAQIRQGKLRGVVNINFRHDGQKSLGHLTLDGVQQGPEREFPRFETQQEMLAAAREIEAEWKAANLAPGGAP